MKNQFRIILTTFLASLVIFASCHKNGGSSTGGGGNTGGGGGSTPPSTTTSDVDFYLTTGNQTSLLQKQNVSLGFGTASNSNLTITVDTTKTYQSIDGFGFNLTDGSAALISGLDASTQNALLQELFGTGDNSIGISYLRISIGASDLSASVYSYDDMPSGQTDTTLQNFSLRKDQSNVVTLLKQILVINSNIKIVATPWSPPAWMKSNSSSVGGSLLARYYNVYANYFVKYIQAMKAEGIPIDAITPQNEPLNPNNNPSLLMQANEEAIFIKNNLGPAFKAANISTKIIAYDHNPDRTDYPLAVLGDAAAYPYVDGSAFHLYGGDISALSTVHNAYPDKNIYFTEQYTASNGDFGGDLKWHLKNVIIGSMRNWSRNALEWNLANDPAYSLHTPGGCSNCKGALTISSTVYRNVSYYIVAHASRFVLQGSYRVDSNNAGSLYNVAFKRPDGKKVLIVENDGATAQTFNISFKGKWVSPTLDAGAVGTFVWQ